jgi:nicotinic acid mononucleotide adenylyltransferase
VYPFQSPGGELVNCENFRVAPHLKHLYVHLRENGVIRTIKDFQPEYLKIQSPRVLELIQKSDASWESMVPPEVAKIIKQRGLFRAPIN